MRALRTQCPAKLNLFLSVGPPDARGYHPVTTIFQAISLHDMLTVTEVEGPPGSLALSCDWEDLPMENTITKAHRMLSELAMVPSLDVRLEKHIPPQSGLGGGSSNAASFLRLANQLLPAPVAEHQLMDIAAAIGMDVPFFLVGGRAVGEGYGERVTPLDDVPEMWFVVVRPNVGVSTPEAYRALDDAPREWRELAPDLQGFYNDFERVMPCDCEDWIERLRVHGAADAGLTGSGSAVFGHFVDQSHAERAARVLREEWVRSYGPQNGVPVWVTRSLSRVESLAVETL